MSDEEQMVTFAPLSREDQRILVDILYRQDVHGGRGDLTDWARECTPIEKSGYR